MENSAARIGVLAQSTLRMEATVDSDAYYREARLANYGLLASLVLRAIKPLVLAADSGNDVPQLQRPDKQRVAALRDIMTSTWRGSLPLRSALEARAALPREGESSTTGTEVTDDIEAYELMRTVLSTPKGEESQWLEEAAAVLRVLANGGWSHFESEEQSRFLCQELQPFLRRLAQPRLNVSELEPAHLSA
jgi:hypothetical protein